MPMWQGIVDELQNLRGQQPSVSKNKGPEFCNHKEIKTVNNLSDFGSEFFLSQVSRWEHSLADILITALWDAKQRPHEIINACDLSC